MAALRISGWLGTPAPVDAPAMIIGRFYFKLTANGNLLGEYSNQLSMNVCPEAAERTRASGDGDDGALLSFVGSYHSTWTQGRAEHYRADLTIGHAPGRRGIILVNWRLAGGVPLFEGEAMLCDDILVGNYQSPGVLPPCGRPDAPDAAGA